ncbi:MAG: hypothetical protein QNJ03_02690 [Dinoroseobacter sp.]|nr:hypothetical protein [Dinoroseobacter sp.]
MKTINKITVAATLTLLAGAANAATVENGSFEDIGSGSLNRSGWNLFKDIPSWSAAHRVEIQSNRTLRTVDAQDGSNYVELVTNRNDSLFQDVYLEIGTYELSFFYSPRVRSPGTTSNNMAFSVGRSDTTLTSGVVEGPAGTDPRWGSWTEITSIFGVAEAGTYTLSFSATGNPNARGCGNCGALVDNVTLAAMPLPGSSLLLLAGIGGLGALHARRKKHQG